MLVEENTICDSGIGISIADNNPQRNMPLPSWYHGTLRPERITIQRNTIFGCTKSPGQGEGGGIGINAGGVNGLKILHNTIALCQQSAVELISNSGVQIKNNIFYQSGNPRHVELWEKTRPESPLRNSFSAAISSITLRARNWPT